MAGTFAAKVLADGQMATTKTAMYTVPALTVAYVKQLYISHANAATQTIVLYLNTSGTSRRWKTIQLAQFESVDVLEDGESVQLQAADIIEGQTTTTTAVDFTITGVEET